MRGSRNSIGQFATKRRPPPDLEFRCPECPLCDKETCSDGDSFYCESCEAHWSTDGRDGSWNEPDAIACPSAIKPYDRADLDPEHEIIRHHVERCILEDGHVDKHRTDNSWGHKWRDGDPRISKAAVTP